MQNLGLIDETLDGVEENRAEVQQMYRQLCFIHRQHMQWWMVFFGGIVHRMLLREL